MIRQCLLLILTMALLSAGCTVGANPTPAPTLQPATLTPAAQRTAMGTPALSTLPPSPPAPPTATSSAAPSRTSTALAGIPTTIATAAAQATPSATAQRTPATRPVTSAPSSPSPTAEAGAGEPGGSPPYLDDRSSAASLMASYVNAVNRREYVRAYSYWRPEAAARLLQPYPQFAAGYADTAAIDLAIGQVRSDAGAGQIYYIVPIVMVAQTTGGAAQTFSACYVMHLSRPEIQAAEPFEPLAIERATVRREANGGNTAGLLASACQGTDASAGSPLPPEPAPDPADISATRYIDNRSTAVAVLRSYFNALNRKEYARAFWYWEPEVAPERLGSLSKFEQGYTQTSSVQMTTGSVTIGAAAGNLYFPVPVTLVAKTAAGATQTFVGCYTLHLGQPAIQGAPPFRPMAIESANAQQVANDADTAQLMSRACPQQ